MNVSSALPQALTHDCRLVSGWQCGGVMNIVGEGNSSHRHATHSIHRLVKNQSSNSIANASNRAEPAIHSPKPNPRSLPPNPAQTERSSAGVCSSERWAAQELADGRARRLGGFQAAPRRARLPAGAHRRRSCAPQRPCTPRWCLRTPRLPAQQRRPSAKAASRGLPAKGAQGCLGNRQRSALRGGALERPTPGLLHGCRLCPLGRRRRVPRVRGRVPRGARGRAADARNLRAVPPRVRGPLR